MGIIVTPQAVIDAYFVNPALSQSTVKGLLKGFDAFMAEQRSEEDKSDAEHFLIGSAVDCVLTGETGEFEKQYHISNVQKKPSEKEMAIIKGVYDELADNSVFEHEGNEITFGDCHDMILMSCNDNSWQMNWKPETRVEKIIDVGTEYFNDLVNSYGKKILSAEQNAKIQQIVLSLRTNRRTSKFFDRVRMANAPSTFNFYFQLPIYFKFKGEDCKALMDLVIVESDEEGNILHVWPYDLKTMAGNNKYFLNSLKTRRYDIQAAWYTMALSSHFDVPISEIEPFSFIVESSTYPGRPLIFEVDSSLLEIGFNGRPPVKLIDSNLFSDQDFDVTLVKEILGIEQLMEQFKWYQEQGWQEDMDIAEADGYLKLSWEGIL